MSEIQCDLIGNLEFHPWCRMFEQLRRVYGVGGICPALDANGGGHREVKVLEVYEL